MIIDTHDGQYKDIIKAVPMEKVADSSTGDTATITSDTRKDVVVIQEYIERDPRKQLFSIHDDSNDQKSKQFYLKKIEELFQKCMTIGGGKCLMCITLKVEYLFCDHAACTEQIQIRRKNQ